MASAFACEVDPKTFQRIGKCANRLNIVKSHVAEVARRIAGDDTIGKREEGIAS